MKPKIIYITKYCKAQHVMHIAIQEYLKYARKFVKDNHLDHKAWWISSGTMKHAKKYDDLIMGKHVNCTVDDVSGCIAALFFYIEFISHYAYEENIHKGMTTAMYIAKTLKMMAKSMRVLGKDDKNKVKQAVSKCPAPTGATLDARIEFIKSLNK